MTIISDMRKIRKLFGTNSYYGSNSWNRFIGSCIVIQSIFQISIMDKIQSFGQLRTIGATKKQLKKIIKSEGRRLGVIGISIGIILGGLSSLILVPNGFEILSYLLQ